MLTYEIEVIIAHLSYLLQLDNSMKISFLLDGLLGRLWLCLYTQHIYTVQQKPPRSQFTKPTSQCLNI